MGGGKAKTPKNVKAQMMSKAAEGGFALRGGWEKSPTLGKTKDLGLKKRQKGHGYPTTGKYSHLQRAWGR